MRLLKRYLVHVSFFFKGATGLTWPHLDFPAVAQFALSALKTLQVVLSSGDQYHLYSTATRALTTAHRRGDARLVEYWSGRPIVSILIAPSVFILVGGISTEVFQVASHPSSY